MTTSTIRDNFVLAVVDLKATQPSFAIRVADLISARVPKMLLACREQHQDALSALEQWADDYVMLPVDMCELVARARALVRRKRMADEAAEITSSGAMVNIVHDGFRLDPARRRVEVDNRALALTENEFRLLHTLAKRPGVVLSRRALLPALRAESEVAPRTIDGLVMAVRRELRAASSEWDITTVRGIGYQFRNTSK